MLYFTYALNALGMIAIPLLLGFFLQRRFGVSWKLFGAGALVFVASQVVHLPLLYGLTALFQTGVLPSPPQAWRLIFNAIVLGLLAGLCEELARYIAYRWFIKSARTWEHGLMVGAGHGGIEAIILGLLVGVTYVAMIVVRTMDLTTLIPPDQLTLAQQQIAAYWSAPWYLTVLGAVERVFAICLHLSLSVMVLIAVVRHAPVWLVAAIAWHSLMDAVAVYLLPTLGPLGIEGVAGGFAGVSLIFLFAMRPMLIPKQNSQEK
jgi:uncharacterized membrane protein YhfC